MPRAADTSASSKPSAELMKALDLDSDDEDGVSDNDDGDVADSRGATKSSKMQAPDTRELALMEYGE